MDLATQQNEIDVERPLQSPSAVQTRDEKLFFTPELYIQNLIQDLANCRESVDIEMYIWAIDDFTERIETELISLADRGVKVRLLVDAIGSYYWIKKRRVELQQKGIRIKVFHPLPGFGILPITPKLMRLFGLINRRNHRKVIIIDHEICYVSSFNMMKISYDWRETTLRITTPAVELISELYNDTWKRANNIFLNVVRSRFGSRLDKWSRARNLFTTQFPQMKREYREHFLHLIAQAKYRVWLTTPYFNPPRHLFNALVEAARRKVDIRILLPAHSDVPYAQWMAQQHYWELLRENIKVYEYQPCVLHAKAAIIDEIGIVGSGNLNFRSFFKDIELNVALENRDSFQELEKQYKADLLASKRIIEPPRLALWKKLITFLLAPLRDSL